LQNSKKPGAPKLHFKMRLKLTREKALHLKIKIAFSPNSSKLLTERSSTSLLAQEMSQK
jgi:hypothetical protein